VCVNDKLIKEGYAVEYDGGKRWSNEIFRRFSSL
jgi:hypothetical protein